MHSAENTPAPPLRRNCTGVWGAGVTPTRRIEPARRPACGTVFGPEPPTKARWIFGPEEREPPRGFFVCAGGLHEVVGAERRLAAGTDEKGLRAADAREPIRRDALDPLGRRGRAADQREPVDARDPGGRAPAGPLGVLDVEPPESPAPGERRGHPGAALVRIHAGEEASDAPPHPKGLSRDDRELQQLRRVPGSREAELNVPATGAERFVHLAIPGERLGRVDFVGELHRKEVPWPIVEHARARALLAHEREARGSNVSPPHGARSAKISNADRRRALKKTLEQLSHGATPARDGRLARVNGEPQRAANHAYIGVTREPPGPRPEHEVHDAAHRP